MFRPVFRKLTDAVAESDAEGIEHHVSRETLRAFQRFLDGLRAPGV